MVRRETSEQPPWEDAAPINLDRVEDFLADMERALRIDKNALDTDCQRHSDYVYRVGRALNYCQSVRDEKKTELAREEAQTDTDIRRAAEQERDKITEAEVKARVRLDRDVQKLQRQLHRLNLIHGDLTALKDAFEDRSRMLRNLTEQFSAGYFSTAVGNSRFMSNIKNDRAAIAKEALRRRINE